MPEENDELLELRDPKTGHYLPGNPSGRAGSTSQASQTRKLIEPHREELVAKALALARSADGKDSAAGIRILLERLSPIPSPEREKVFLPSLATAVTFEARCTAVLEGVATGQISAEAGERLFRLIDIYQNAVTADSVERRLLALEGKLPTPTAERIADDSFDDLA